MTRRFPSRRVGFIVVLNALFWLVFGIVGSSPERPYQTIEPQFGSYRPDGAEIFSPDDAVQTMHSHTRTWVIRLNQGGLYAIGVNPNEFVYYPVFTLLDSDGRVLKDSRSSDLEWYHLGGTRPRQQRPDPVSGTRNPNPHGSGLNHFLEAGVTYFLRMEPNSQESLSMTVRHVQSGRVEQEPRSYTLHVTHLSRLQQSTARLYVAAGAGPLLLFILLRVFFRRNRPRKD